MQKIFYNTIQEDIEYEIPKIKGSRFIGNIFHVKTKQDVDNAIQTIQEKFPDSRHHCYAYRYNTKTALDIFGNIVFSSKENKVFDDGEPASTAGKPIMNIIEKSQIFDIIIFVTRYFGGTKLGIGGLIQAYSECAKEVIAKSKITKTEITSKIKINYSFDLIQTIRNVLEKYDAKIIEEKYDEKVTIQAEINNGYLENFKKELSNATQGEIKI